MGQKRTDSWLGHSSVMWETESNWFLLQGLQPALLSMIWWEQSHILTLVLPAFHFEKCKRYQVSPRGEQKEILKSSKCLWYWTILSCIVPNCKSQLVMECIFIIQKFSSGNEVLLPLFLFGGLCVWTQYSYMPLSTEWVALGGVMGEEALTLSPGTALDLVQQGACCGWLSGSSGRTKEMPCKCQQTPERCKGYCTCSFSQEEPPLRCRRSMKLADLSVRIP